jgi:hypothetical protein
MNLTVSELLTSVASRGLQINIFHPTLKSVCVVCITMGTLVSNQEPIQCGKNITPETCLTCSSGTTTSISSRHVKILLHCGSNMRKHEGTYINMTLEQMILQYKLKCSLAYSQSYSKADVVSLTCLIRWKL